MITPGYFNDTMAACVWESQLEHVRAQETISESVIGGCHAVQPFELRLRLVPISVGDHQAPTSGSR